MDRSPADVSYVTVRRPFGEPLAIPDYELDLYQELAPGVSGDGREAHIVANALFGILVVDNAFEHTVHLWFEGKVEKFGWDVSWHDTLEAAELDLAARVAADR